MPLHLLRLARGVREWGVSPFVVSLAPAGPVSRMLSGCGVPTAALGAPGPWDWRVLERLAAHIAETVPDVVHSFLFHANIAARVACVLSGFTNDRLICEIQTVEIERAWHLPVDRWTQRACRVIVGNSQSVIDHLRAAGIQPSRLRLVPGAIDPAPIRSAQPIPRLELGLTNGDPLLLWVGRLDPVKGLDELLTAFDRVCVRCPCNLIFVGDGAYRASLEAAIRALGQADRIRLLGARNDVPAILKSADIFVFPSRTEGMPNALLEAMSAGLPCIATDVSGCRDVITDGVDGMLVPARDPLALAGAIERLLSDSMARDRLSRAAKAKIDRRFDPAAMLSAYLSLYDEVRL